MSEEVDRWMRMLNERLDECLATLHRDRMAVEVVFREHGDDGEWLYWFSIQGSGAPATADEVDESSRHPIDRDHIELGRRCKEPGWTEMEPQLVLLPEPVRRAVLAWAAGQETL